MIRFVSKDGMGNSTQMLDAETGDNLSKIVAIEYGAMIEIGQEVKASCRIAMIELNIVAGKTEFHTKHPLTGEYVPVAAIEFRDGVRIEIAEDGTPAVAALSLQGGVA